MSFLYLRFIFFVALWLVVVIEQTNSERHGPVRIPDAIDMLFPSSKGSPSVGANRETTLGTSQSALTKCPPCPHRKGPKAPVCEATIDLGFLVESSNSVGRLGPGNFQRLIQFVGLIVRKFSVSKKNTRIGVVTFSSQPKLLFGMTGDIATVVKGLQNATTHRDPFAKTGAALKFAYYNLFKRSRRFNKVLVVITDGSSSDTVTDAATSLKQEGVKMISVGVGRYFNIEQLNAMASRPVQQHVFTGQFSKIIHTRDEIVKTICYGVGGSLISPCKRPCLCKTG